MSFMFISYFAGFDLRTEEGYYDVMTKFDKIIGFKYLKALHINDSKGDTSTKQLGQSL